ncbi:MAG: phosphatidylglycerol lysyltransferase domain-containing protein [Spirochaetaceae bacterium]|nr:phosphatidylglycerol lysyltransferase domain-containing protein [Spirochaetaceae bacterium]
MEIPCYPDFSPLAFEHGEALKLPLASAPDGVSEFTFANLYLFRQRYNYRICFADGNPVILGERESKTFFMTPLPVPAKILEELINKYDYWKNIPESVLSEQEELIKSIKIDITEDRDNFDYLYLSEDLAKLSGKKFHKKRNLVNAFMLSYNSHEVKPLDADLIPQCFYILDRWRESKHDEGDYIASKEALSLYPKLAQEGAVFYVNERPAGYCFGESTAQGKIFALHFEKAIEEYKGIYQYINQRFAEILSKKYLYINREQDLGDEGLRQAKMTYRPTGFVKKYIGTKLR